jgi:hypothetical protein
MGKRELLLIGGFILVGTVVYYATAPASSSGQTRVAISRFLDHVRRELRGNPANAEVRHVSTLPVQPAMTELRLETASAAVTLTGEDRKDVECDLLVWSNGPDEAEAKRYADETLIRSSDAGSSLVLGIKYPDPGQQRATLALKMPKSLGLRVQPSRGRLEINNVTNVELAEARGQVTLRGVSGRASVVHRGGTLTLENIAALKLNSRGSVVVVKDVKGDALLQTQAGELRASGLAGGVEIESNGSRISLEDLRAARRPIRINAVGGAVALTGVRSETRIDGRDTRITVTIDQPAPLSIYNESEEGLDVTLPARGGFQLDAIATHGRLTVPDALRARGRLEITTVDDGERASGAIDGGGPTITLRASRGNITLRTLDVER